MTLEDAYVTKCEAEHSEPVEGCLNCELRAEALTCATCGMQTSGDETGDRYPECLPTVDGRHAWFDGFNVEHLCPVVEPGMYGTGGRCNDPITTPGALACDHHQRLIDSVEAGKIYQRLVAVR